MKIKKRIFSILLSLFVCIFCVISNYEEAKADAGLITIIGEGIGAGGMAAAGAAGVALGPVLAVVGVALAGYGIYTNISDGAAEQGITKTEYIGQQLQNFADKAGQTFDLVINTIAYNIHCTQDGLIKLGDAAAEKIDQFVNWITGNTEENFYDGDITEIPSQGLNNGYIGTLNVVEVTDGSIISISQDNTGSRDPVYCEISNRSADANQKFYCYQYPNKNNTYLLAIMSTSTIDVRVIYHKSDGSILDTVNPGSTGHKGFWYQKYAGRSLGTHGAYDVPSYGSDQYSIFADLPATFVGGEYVGSGINTFYGDLDGINQKREQLQDRQAGDVIVLNPGLLDELAPDIPADKEYGVSVPDYLDTLQRVLDQDLAIDMPVEDIDDGIIVDLPIDDGLTLNPELVVAPETDYPQEQDTPVLNPDIPASPDSIVQPMLLDLTGIFPFCIPFDLYALMQKFVDDPVAPNIDINFTIPIANVEVDYTFDLAPFNTVALILRNIEMAALIVGLAVATRRIYLRG